MPLSADIEINAPPSVVRDVFLDFQGRGAWHTSFWKSPVTYADGKPITDGKALSKGQKLAAEIPAMKFNPVVESNDETAFRWIGGIPYIAAGDHIFAFEPAGDNKTKFAQTETFSGILSLMGYNDETKSNGKKTKDGWIAFNEDLKKEAERVYAAKK